MDSNTIKIKSTSQLAERDAKCIWHPYTQQKTAAPPLPIVRGEKTLLFDENGNQYIDAVSSWWVNIHGHAHPYIAERVYQQMMELEHVIFAGFTHDPAVTLAERLLTHLPKNQSRVFYSDNGSTAVEIAMKMALQYFHNQGIERRYLIAFDDAFHGETFGAMSASADLSLNNAFKSHLFEVIRIPAPTKGNEEKSIQTLKNVLAKGEAYAFLFEPLIQGAGGMIMYDAEPLSELIGLCKAADVLTIADEVMTGFYRTGRFLASDYLSEKPDLICLAKGITGGTLPLAVTTCTEAIFEAFLSTDKYKTFFHGHSYTANPSGCAAGLASLDILERPSHQVDIQRIVSHHESFAARMKTHAAAKDVRQQGTILAIEFKTAEATSYFNNIRDELYYFFLAKGLLLRPLGNVIYIMPPYCITAEELEKVYAGIEEALDCLAAGRALR